MNLSLMHQLKRLILPSFYFHKNKLESYEGEDDLVESRRLDVLESDIDLKGSLMEESDAVAYNAKSE